VSNQTRGLIEQAQLRYIFQQGLDGFQKCFIDSTAVEASTDRPTESTILVKLIARIRTTGGNLHRLDLPDSNRIIALAVGPSEPSGRNAVRSRFTSCSCLLIDPNPEEAGAVAVQAFELA
jgi:hypothetical protein